MYQNGLKNCQETIPNVIHPEKHKDEIEIAVVSLDGRKFIDKLSVLLETYNSGHNGFIAYQLAPNKWEADLCMQSNWNLWRLSIRMLKSRNTELKLVNLIRLELSSLLSGERW